MKYILIIGDGMADNPVPALDNKTPAARGHPCDGRPGRQR